jgi:hypothetical protein
MKKISVNSVKLKIPSFGIEEWIILDGGSNKSLRYLLNKYISSHPISGVNGLAYTEYGGYLKSLTYNNGSGLIIQKEAPSIKIGDFYITIFWRYIILQLSGRSRGRFPLGGVPMDGVISFRNGDTLDLGLIAVSTTVSI